MWSYLPKFYRTDWICRTRWVCSGIEATNGEEKTRGKNFPLWRTPLQIYLVTNHIFESAECCNEEEPLSLPGPQLPLPPPAPLTVVVFVELPLRVVAAIAVLGLTCPRAIAMGLGDESGDCVNDDTYIGICSRNMFSKKGRIELCQWSKVMESINKIKINFDKTLCWDLKT